MENCDVEYIFYSSEYRDSNHIRTIRELNRDKLKAFKEGFLIMNEPFEVLQNADGEYKYEADIDSVCGILFTSGTAKMAKGVMLTHRNIVNNSHAIVRCLKRTHEDRVCYNVSCNEKKSVLHQI